MCVHTRFSCVYRWITCNFTDYCIACYLFIYFIINNQNNFEYSSSSGIRVNSTTPQCPTMPFVQGYVKGYKTRQVQCIQGEKICVSPCLHCTYLVYVYILCHSCPWWTNDIFGCWGLVKLTQMPGEMEYSEFFLLFIIKKNN